MRLEMSKGISETAILRIEIEHLPYPELSPNSRLHWAVKARAVKAAREEVGWLAKAQWRDKLMARARISYEFYVKDKRRRDLDNLLAMAKPWQDGLVDAGVLEDDDAEHLEIGYSKVIRSNAERSIILIEQIIIRKH